jgi:hypothetical protein
MTERLLLTLVMAGLVPAIHVFPTLVLARCGCLAQGHGCPVRF